MTVAATSSVVPARPVRVSAASRSRRASVSPSRKNSLPRVRPGDTALAVMPKHTYPAAALRLALDLLGHQQPEQALQALTNGLAAQRAVVARRRQALAAAQFARAPEAAVRTEQACCAGEEAGLAALEHVIGTFAEQAEAQAEAEAEAEGQHHAIAQHYGELAAAARQPWADLAELIWQFDAHVQDRLAALSESQAIGYQLGRGLADTYWALNPGQEHGSASWSFLLGDRRCDELQRLTGRVAAYMGEYTAAAIAGSLEVWRAVVAAPGWMGDPTQTSHALYSQIRRWYELIVLGQDPTTLIGPAAVMRNYRTLARAFQLFWPELAATVFGLAALITLLFLVNVDGAAAWEKTLSGVLAVVGLSLAGLTGTLKNSAQALTKRLRQDAYTDLVALAVQTAPAPPDHSALQRAINHRALTPATPN